MDPISYLRFIGALAFVLGLLAFGTWLLRRYGHRFPGLAIPGQASTRRLGVVEALSIGPRQRLLLVRRDGVEHLLLIGQDGQTVVETGIGAEIARG